MPAAAAAQQKPERPARIDWNPRPSIRIGEDIRFDFRLKVQADFRGFSPAQPTDTDMFELHRRRAGIEGEFFNRIEFQIERELGRRGLWRDLFVHIRFAEALEVRVGKFKLPFGLEETTGTMDLDFIYRTRGSDAMAPARDVGVKAEGRLGRLFEYEAGRFRHDGENARLTEPAFVLPGEEVSKGGPTIVGRVVVTPWGRGGGSRPRIGAAATTSTVPEGLNSLRGRTVFESTFFPRVYVRGRRVRVGAEGEWKPGPLGFRSEYIRVSDDRYGQGLGDVDLSDFIGQSWYASATWVITGESKADGVQPRTPLFQGGIGAIEVGTRFESLRFGSASRVGPAFRNPRADHVMPNEDRVWTSGVNWYVNRWFKIQLNVIRETFEDEERTPVLGDRMFWSAVMRLQVVL